jgi:hypothetical protein
MTDLEKLAAPLDSWGVQYGTGNRGLSADHRSYVPGTMVTVSSGPKVNGHGGWHTDFSFADGVTVVQMGAWE